MAEKSLQVEIVTPYELFFEGPVESVVVTAKNGETGILPGHAPMIAALVPGEIRLKINGEWVTVSATNGYAEIAPDIAIIVVNAAEWPEQINVERARESISRARARLADSSLSDQEHTHAKHAIERAKSRIRIAAKYQKELEQQQLF